MGRSVHFPDTARVTFSIFVIVTLMELLEFLQLGRYKRASYSKVIEASILQLLSSINETYLYLNDSQ